MKRTGSFFLFVVISFSLNAYKPIIIGIAGGTASGKTTLTHSIQNAHPNAVTIISQDNYYFDISHLSQEEQKNYNFDVPESINFPLLAQHLSDLKEGKEIPRQSYSFVSKKNIIDGYIQPNRVIIVEGIFILAVQQIANLCDYKIYTEVSDDVRGVRRFRRYHNEYSRSYEELMDQYLLTVKPGHDTYVAPSRWEADIVVPTNKPTNAAEAFINSLIREHIQRT